MHKADSCKQAEEEISGCDKVYSAEGSDCHNSTAGTLWTITREAISCDHSVVRTRVSHLMELVRAHEF